MSRSQIDGMVLFRATSCPFMGFCALLAGGTARLIAEPVLLLAVPDHKWPTSVCAYRLAETGGPTCSFLALTHRLEG